MNGKDDDRMEKYELTNEIKNLPDGVVLYRIRALKDFADVKAGDLGGFVQSEFNLSQEGNAWVYENACVYGNAGVFENAKVCGNSKMHGYSYAGNDARVYGNTEMSGFARLYGHDCVTGDALISGADDFVAVKGFGRVHRTTVIFRCKDGIARVRCGCFYGTLDEFRAKVKETHGDGKMAREYLMIADLMELHFKKE